MKTYALALSALLLLAGCSEKKEEEKQTPVAATATGSIEVSRNANAYEQKVAEKTADKNQSKSFYFDYNTQEKKGDSAQKRTTFDANMHVRSPYEQIEIELMVHKLSKDFIVKCSACHNDYANGIIGPSLLDKDATSIYTTIAAYKNGTKENVLMRALVKQMSDAEIRKLANEIATFNIEIKKMRAERGSK